MDGENVMGGSFEPALRWGSGQVPMGFLGCFGSVLWDKLGFVLFFPTLFCIEMWSVFMGILHCF